MSRPFQTPSLTSPYHRMVENADESDDKAPSAPNDTAINAVLPEYSPVQTEIMAYSDRPPPYSALGGPTSPLPVQDNSQYPAQLAITKQPGPQAAQPASVGSWLPIIYSGPPGLEYLASVQHLIVNHKTEFLQALSGFKYTILNSLGQLVYSAEEDADFGDRMCYGALHSLEIQDTNRAVVLRLIRETNCESCCCPQQRLEVFSTRGLIGAVQNEFACLRKEFRVLDSMGQEILGIQGNFGIFGGESVFEVLDMSGLRVGTITMQRSGFITMNYKYDVTFPINSGVEVKATLLGAIFLIDFLHKEMLNNRNNGRR